MTYSFGSAFFKIMDKVVILHGVVLVNLLETSQAEIERYQKPVAFGTINICNYTEMHSQVLMLLAG